MASAAHLLAAFGPRLKRDEPLSKHVQIRIGGPADWYVEVGTSDEIVLAVQAALADRLPCVVLGGGSNTLPSDDGFRGLVIQAANRQWRIDPPSSDGAGETRSLVWAESGVPSGFLARKTAEAGLTGFEWAVSLPGTIGGAVRGNAGCFGGETKDMLLSVDALRLAGGRAERLTIPKEDCAFGYRESAFKHGTDIVLAATFVLAEASKEACLARIDAVLAKRKVEQPNDAPSAGCLFKNFEYTDEHALDGLHSRLDVPEPFLQAKRLPAGWLIDQAGLKGTRIGQAQVSEKHGNFLVNVGGASASDVLQLISLVKARVRDAYGLQLEEEVQLLGFNASGTLRAL